MALLLPARPQSSAAQLLVACDLLRVQRNTVRRVIACGALPATNHA